jgi:hypothetical protein
MMIPWPEPASRENKATHSVQEMAGKKQTKRFGARRNKTFTYRLGNDDDDKNNHIVVCM